MGGGGGFWMQLEYGRPWTTRQPWRTRRTQLFFTPGMQCNRTAPQTIISNVIWITSHSHHIVSIISTVARDVSIPTLSMNIHGCFKSSSYEINKGTIFIPQRFLMDEEVFSHCDIVPERRSSRAGWSITTVPTILCITIPSGLDCYIAYVLYACVLGSYWLLFKYE